jgi:hypothetical protein
MNVQLPRGIEELLSHKKFQADIKKYPNLQVESKERTPYKK